MSDSEVERATVSKAERHLLAAPMKLGDIQAVKRRNAPLNLHVRGDRLAGLVGEMLVHGEMVVNPPETASLVTHVSFGYRLLYQALHGSTCARVYPGTAHTPAETATSSSRARAPGLSSPSRPHFCRTAEDFGARCNASTTLSSVTSENLAP